uniref:L1 transposable element RRM domain-containing protein n=1 Tax=Xenopus tropicalis TaxID=8364 RepID=A0A6I8QT02_XENTR
LTLRWKNIWARQLQYPEQTETTTEPFNPQLQMAQAQELAQLLGPLLDQKLASIKESMVEILQQVTNQTQRMTEAEQRISTLEDELDKAQKSIDLQQHKIIIMADKIDDLENRSRRNNLRLVGIPESVKGTELEQLLKIELPKMLNMEEARSHYLIERYHRIGPPPLKDSNRPRQIIFKLLNYADKMNILAAYRKTKDLHYQDHHIMLFQDFSCKEFSKVCQALINRNINFSLMYPAKLKIFLPSGTRIFNDPLEASTFREYSDLYPLGKKEDTYT